MDILNHEQPASVITTSTIKHGAESDGLSKNGNSEDPFENPIPTPPNTNGNDEYGESPPEQMQMEPDNDGEPGDDMDTASSPPVADEVGMDLAEGGELQAATPGANEALPATTINPSQLISPSFSNRPNGSIASIGSNGTLKRSFEDEQGEEDASKRQKVDHPSSASPSLPPEDPPTSVPSEGPLPLSSQQPPSDAAPHLTTYVAPVGLIEPPAPRPPTQTTLCSSNQLKYMASALKQIKRLKASAPFLQPVDPVALNIPNYPNVIKFPMDLGTIELKVLAAQGKREAGWRPQMGVMESPEMFRDDLRRIWWNCKIYNGTTSIFTTWAIEVEKAAEKMLDKMPKPPPPPPPKPTPLAIASSSTYSPPAMEISKPSKSKKAQPGAPTIRRSSSISMDGRPKREIHPPAPKELPYFADLDVKKPKLGNRKVDKEIRWGLSVLKELGLKRNKDFVWPFESPVDPVALSIPDYFKVIKRPMDLSTIKRKLESGVYRDNPSTESVEGDFRLMLDNCFTYNPPGTSVHIFGRKVEAVFDRMWEDFQKIDLDEGFDEEGIQNSIKAEDNRIQRIRSQIQRLDEELKDAEAKKAKHVEHLQKERERVKAQKKAKKERQAAQQAAYEQAYAYDYDSPVASTSKKADAAQKKKKPKTKTKKKEELPITDKMSMPYQYSETLSRKIETDGDNPIVADAVAYLSTQLQMTADSEDGTVELEIDNVQPEILWKVYEMIFGPVDESIKWSSTNGNNPAAAAAIQRGKSRLANGGGVTASGGRAKKGGRAGTGGVNRKNLDEEAESAKIRALEDRLKAFDEHERGGGSASSFGAGGVPGYGGGAAALMEGMGQNDDDVSSESSEEEVSSEDESD